MELRKRRQRHWAAFFMPEVADSRKFGHKRPGDAAASGGNGKRAGVP